MARTVLTVQRLAARGGQEVTFSPPDAANGHQYRNTGVEVVLVKADSGASLQITVPSVADPFNRLGDQTVTIPAAAGTRLYALGPYSPPQIWGDGASQGFLNVSSVSGSSGVAVIIV